MFPISTFHADSDSMTNPFQDRGNDIVMDATYNEESLAKFEDGSEKLKEYKNNFHIRVGLITRAHARKLRETVNNFLMQVKEDNVLAQDEMGLKMFNVF